MKKNIIKNTISKLAYILVALSVTVTSFSCKSMLEDRYTNPEETEIANIPAFLTQILNNSRLRSEYWHYRTFTNMHHARYTQTLYFSNENTMYQQQDSYIFDYWKDFYSPGILGVYRSLERTYANDQSGSMAFLHAARVVVFDQASKMVDNFGDIPFSEAGSLPQSDEQKLPKFDDQKELYMTFLEGLKESAAFFATASTDAEFTRADILNNGNIDKWRRYANSLRLRLLMRISNVETSFAQAEIMEILNNPSEYPLIDGGNVGNYEVADVDVLNTKLNTYTSSLLDAMRELRNNYAPDYMLNTVLNNANDPRVHVMFDKYGRGTGDSFVANEGYKAFPITATAAEVNQEYGTDGQRRYAVIDSATAWINNNLPGILFTASEVNFIKAEAFERWGSTSQAKVAYETAVRQSVSFYYYLNNASSHAQKVPMPSDEAIDALIASSSVAYAGATEDKLKLIGTQKWLHFGWLQAEQNWAEYRRTGYPLLPAFPTSSLNGFQRPPVRLVYPSNEVTNNSVNYEAVRAKDTRDTKLFWDVN